MKYISPGSWFSLEYPAGWNEFEDTEDSFLFYNPEKWNGNFRISAFKGQDKKYAEECMFTTGEGGRVVVCLFN